jgi:hypothetical protein
VRAELCEQAGDRGWFGDVIAQDEHQQQRGWLCGGEHRGEQRRAIEVEVLRVVERDDRRVHLREPAQHVARFVERAPAQVDRIARRLVRIARRERWKQPPERGQRVRRFRARAAMERECVDHRIDRAIRQRLELGACADQADRLVGRGREEPLDERRLADPRAPAHDPHHRAAPARRERRRERLELGGATDEPAQLANLARGRRHGEGGPDVGAGGALHRVGSQQAHRECGQRIAGLTRSGQPFVEHRADGIPVARRVDRTTGHLFGRRIPRRAGEAPGGPLRLPARHRDPEVE